MTTARRIIVNKDGEYIINANFSHAGTPGTTWLRVVRMVSDASETGMTILGISPLSVVGSVTVRLRVVAGQSFGAFVGALGGSTDSADPLGGVANANPNNFSIVRLSD